MQKLISKYFSCFQFTEWEKQSRKQASKKAGQKVTIDDVVARHDLQKISKKIAGHWERVASKLRPKPAKREEIDAMKRDAGTLACNEELAAAMFEKWQNSYGTKATVRCLIESLIDSGFLKFAEDVFGSDLTWQVKEEMDSD